VMLLSYFPVMVGATESATDIKAIQKPTGISIVENYDDYVGDSWLSQLGLPDSVTVTLANGTTTDVLVSWDTSSLDPRTTGYYSLPGEVALPVGVTNGQKLTVGITVQVREYENLIQNPSFEDNLTGWYIRGTGPAPSQTDAAAADGKYAALVGGKVAYTNTSIADTRNSIITQIPAAGQYYFSTKAQYTASAYPDGAFLVSRLLYKTTSNSSSVVVDGNKALVGNTSFAQSAGIVQMPENTNWIRLDLYMIANAVADHSAGQLCVDDAELVPLLYALAVEPSGVLKSKPSFFHIM